MFSVWERIAPERVYACRCGAHVSPVTTLPALPEPSLSPQTTECATHQPGEQHENREKERGIEINW